MKPELLSFLATPVSYAEIEVLTEYSSIAADGSVRPIMYPAVPFRIRWRYWSLAANVTGGVPLRARILSEDRGATLYTSPLIPYAKGGVGETLDSIVFNADQVNRIGNRSLILQIEFPTAVQVPVEAVADYMMAEPYLDSTTWLTPVGGVASTAPLQLDWNSDYQIQGTYLNPVMVTIEGSVELIEYSEGNPTSTVRDTEPVTKVGPLGTVPLLFDKVKQNWGWLVPGVWVMYGDRSRAFRYELRYSVTDQFNNPYGFVHGGTDSLHVVVVVSTRKWALGAAAMAAAILAVILLALVWLIGPSWATTAYQLAGGLGKAALDPPTPDPAYRRGVAIKVPQRRFARTANSWFQKLAAVIVQADTVAAYDLGLYAIEARMLGAIRAKNSKALRQQKSDYARALKAYTAAAAETSRCVDIALKDPALTQIATDERWRSRLRTWSARKRVTSPSRRVPAWANRLLRQPELVNAALTGGISQALEMLRGGVVRGAAAATADHARIKKLTIRSR